MIKNIWNDICKLIYDMWTSRPDDDIDDIVLGKLMAVMLVTCLCFMLVLSGMLLVVLACHPKALVLVCMFVGIPIGLTKLIASSYEKSMKSADANRKE